MLALSITVVASGWFPRSAAALVSTGDGTWVWQNPLPQGNALFGVSCPSISTCFAVGDVGTILATTTGGATWASQTSGTKRILSGVSCPSTSTCIAVGSSGDNGTFGNTILETGNGGSNWNARASGTNDPLYGVSCPSASTCFAVGWGGTILATTDGGSTWAAQYSPVGGTFTGISCPTTRTCFAVGQYAIVATTDGGTTWAAQNTGANPNLLGVSCPSTSTCFAGGSFGAILATTDGGSTWTARNSGTGADVRGISCPSTSSCFAALGGLILGTTDGGSTWTKTYSSSANAAHLQLVVVSCPSTTTCYAVGYSGGIAATTDGGGTWTALSSGNTQFLPGVSCPSTSTCFAVGSFGTILATADGGSAWTAQNSGVSNQDLAAVSCPSTSACFAVGGSGTILATTDGGSTWTARTSGTTNALGGISCPSASTCFAVGGSGTILATADGGSTWTAESAGTSANLRGISCPSTTTCFAVGWTFDTATATFSSTILATANGGSTWTAQSSVSASLRGVSCPSSTTCVAVGGSSSTVGGPGTILVTTDGGSTWTPQDSGTGFNTSPFGVSCPSASTCFAVGGSGSILFGSLRVSTPPPPLPGAPQGLQVTPLNGQADVRWFPPATNANLVTGYTITAEPLDNNRVPQPNVAATVQTNKASELSVLMTGLLEDCHQFYDISVRATSTGGNGAPAISAEFRPSGVLSHAPPYVVILLDGIRESQPGFTMDPYLPTAGKFSNTAPTYCPESSATPTNFGETNFAQAPNGPWSFFHKWNFGEVDNPPPPAISNGQPTGDVESTPKAPNPVFPSTSYIDTNSFMLDAIAGQGAIILPFSYAGSTFGTEPNGDPLFTFNGYSECDSTPGLCPLSPSTNADAVVLGKEVHAVAHIWPQARIVVLGHSQGGLIASKWWANHIKGKTYRSSLPPNFLMGFSLDSPINGLCPPCISHALTYPIYNDRVKDDAILFAKDASTNNSFRFLGSYADSPDLVGIHGYGSGVDTLQHQLLVTGPSCGQRGGLVDLSVTTDCPSPPDHISHCLVSLPDSPGWETPHFVVKYCPDDVKYFDDALHLSYPPLTSP